jgi:heptosyltransferase-2
MENILIIKTGAAGDVVRTTSLLNVLQGNIYWVTANESKPLLPDIAAGLKVLSVEEAFRSLRDIKFSRVISLEEDNDSAMLAGEINTNDLTGLYMTNGKMNYTDNSACWFDMSRVSKFGLAKANKLKAENPESFQFYIFKMLGKKFSGEPYRVFTDDSVKAKNKLIGIEKRTGRQWPNKQWWGYDKLISKLEKENYPVKVFEQRSNIRNYLRDIAACSHIVSGDTLAMHIALAYKKTCTAIFNCTSPQEIYDYGLLKKVVSTLLSKYFYSSSFDKEVVESVPLDEVYNTLSVLTN